MKFVAIRDDDTNALTPVECLDHLYRPFLDRGLPVNLAVIPNVRTDITYGSGIPEGFLFAKNGVTDTYLPIGKNKQLVRYLLDRPGYCIVQHGCTHEFVGGGCEFELPNPADAATRLETGRRLFAQAKLPSAPAFVAPYDRFTRQSMAVVAREFPLISANWYELRNIPRAWWMAYLKKKLRKSPHWRAGNTLLLTHPGCHLSCHRPLDSMLNNIKLSIASRRLTVLVTHWWEYYPGGDPNDEFIAILHRTADYLASQDNIKVVSFREIASGSIGT